MKTILLHGLGQTEQDWKEVVCQLSSSNVDCPELFSSMENTANLKASKRLKELLPQATLHIIPNAGHELNKYAPNMIAEILNN